MLQIPYIGRKNVRKGEKGSLVVCADKIIRTKTDGETGEETEHAIPFMKGSHRQVREEGVARSVD